MPDNTYPELPEPLLLTKVTRPETPRTLPRLPEYVRTKARSFRSISLLSHNYLKCSNSRQVCSYVIHVREDIPDVLLYAIRYRH